jgi:uncharacterized protein (DUF427 family)
MTEEKVAVAPEHRVELVPAKKRVRVYFGHQLLADSSEALIVRESGQIPVYYFPKTHVQMELVTAGGENTRRSSKGKLTRWSPQVGEMVAQEAAWGYVQPEPDYADLVDYVAFEWDAMDAWFEEDEQVFVHARDPYKRIDVLHSSRHVQVVVGGQTAADTHRPVLLFETGLPIRYYIPKLDVRMDLLLSSDTVTRCPYKGEASYYTVQAGEKQYVDLVWYYRYPLPEVGKIENLLCFYNERVDALYVDGELQTPPETRWSE